MPRRYRPPATRRKTKKTNIPYHLDQAPDGDSPLAAADTDIEATDATEVAEPPQPVAPRSTTRSSSARHMARDYSYVGGEVRRILVVAGFLIVSLAITAILRN